jgi:uncharacterized iron-regulated membrane protein
MNRQFYVLMHRYVGLVMTLFLVIVALTGSLIAFYNELDDLANQHLVYANKPHANAKLIDPFALRDKVLVMYPNSTINYLKLVQPAGKSAAFYLEPKIDPATKKPFVLTYQTVFVNPYTGAFIGGRNANKISESWRNIMPFIYELHYSLALGTIGGYVLGIIALFWTIDCFVGAYLTFPAKRKSVATQGDQAWVSRWWKAWKIRWNGGFYKLNFDFHRASGLWLWAMLFVFAWSSVGFNLTEVYSPVMKAMFTVQNREIKPPSSPLENPLLDFRQAYLIGQKLMAIESKEKGFTVVSEEAVNYDEKKGTYFYEVKSDREVADKYGSTNVIFNANTGEKISSYIPSGEAAGDTIGEWLFTLHMGKIWGLPMQIFICVMGLVITGLSVTGVVIWLKKRNSRNVVKRQNMPKLN